MKGPPLSVVGALISPIPPSSYRSSRRVSPLDDSLDEELGMGLERGTSFDLRARGGQETSLDVLRYRGETDDDQRDLRRGQQ